MKVSLIAKLPPQPLLAASVAAPLAPALIDDAVLFGALFSATALETVFKEEFAQPKLS